MVFHCRCFSFPLEEEIDIDTKTQTNSTYTETFYTAPSEFNKAIVSNLVDKTSNLRVFTYAELKAATNNFCNDSKIGEDGFGSVYKGVIKSTSENPLDEFQVTIKYGALKRWLKKLTLEVNVLGVAEHPNIVKLVGYCSEHRERGLYGLLVYEYVPNKSVNHHLSTKSETPLSWARRLKVAQDVARALTHLHQEMEFQVFSATAPHTQKDELFYKWAGMLTGSELGFLQHTFENFTSSNIFLDEHWNAKLSDFRVTPLGLWGGLTDVSTMTYETTGYAAPEYMLNRTHTPKGNTWSYGVFLYELITGKPPLDRTRPKNQQLLEWVKPFLGSKSFQQILAEPKLKGNYTLKSAKKLSFIANRCLSQNPNLRPNMREVLEMVNELIGLPSQATNTAQEFKSTVRGVAMKLKKVFMCTTKDSQV